MTDITFKAMLVEEYEKGKYSREITERKLSDLPENDVLIKVSYSSLNYKDALSAGGHKGITRQYPHTPGIDASGTVVESGSPDIQQGEKVLVTGYDLGMNTPGGFAQYISVPAEWVVKLPEELSLKEAMMYGTAGFTAGISIFELQEHDISPYSGSILVTGASGGVGSLACGMLSKAGYKVIASSGKNSDTAFFESLGVSKLTGREEMEDEPKKPLLSKRWKGAIDTIGGETLQTAVKSADHRGVVCTMGNVLSDKFSLTVYPFILRGVKLVGIDSASRPMNERKYIWSKIASDWKIDNYEQHIKEVSLEELSGEIDLILQGKQKGRIIVNLEA